MNFLYLLVADTSIEQLSYVGQRIENDDFGMPNDVRLKEGKEREEKIVFHFHFRVSSGVDRAHGGGGRTSIDVTSFVASLSPRSAAVMRSVSL